MSVEPALRQISPDLVSYVVEVACEDGPLDIVVVFRPGPDEDRVASAKGRIQWFVSVFIGIGEMREVGTDVACDAVYPVDTLFLVSHLENEAFWCGPGDVDETMVRKASHLPDALRWGWEPCGHVVVNEVNTSVGEA